MKPHHSRPDWTGRLGSITSAVVDRALDALVVSNLVNIRYLTGFPGSAGLLLVGRRSTVLVVDGRYAGPVRSAIAQGEVAGVTVEVADGPFARALGAIVGGAGMRHVGFEAESVTVAALSSWQERTPGVEWLRTDRLVEEHRQVKDAYEVGVFRTAGRLLSDVARGLPGLVRGGLRELDIARSIDRSIEAVGFSTPAFPTIVASGPHSAQPHARPTDRRLEPGDLVVLDFGGVLDGYCVDLTRMAAVGTVAPDAMRLFEAVRDAQAAALAAVRAGVPVGSVDTAARDVLAGRGLSDAFVHATGHGLGLEVHEAPRIGRARTTEPEPSLVEGMVCTIEPGAYVEGIGGARLEDDVLVTADGHEALTTAPTGLLIV